MAGTTQPVEHLAEAQEQQEPELGTPWEDLRAYVAVPRATSLELSPDGRWLLLGTSTLSDDQTAYRTALWRLPTDGGRPRRLTRGTEGEAAAGLLRDGSVVFTSKRPVPAEQDRDEKDDALWCLPAAGGEAYVLARRKGGWLGVTAAREADRLVCPVGLRAGLDDEKADQELRARREKKKVHAILHEAAGVRYWDHDLGSDTVRLQVLDLEVDERDGDPRARRPRLATDDLGRGLSTTFALSGDGSFAVADLDVLQPRGERRGTLVRLDLATGECRTLLEHAEHAFGGAVLSRDDRLVACTRWVPSTAQRAPRTFLHLLDLATGDHRDLAPGWDRWGTPVGFSPDASTLYVVADEDGEAPVFAVDVASGAVRRLTQHGAHSNVRVAPDGSCLYALRTAWDEPGSVVRIDVASAASTVLHQPAGEAGLPGTLERIETTTAEGHRVPGWLCLPAGASAEQPVPLVLWVHGGPLGSWNAWSWRWCPWLLVSQGWAVLLPDPSLSTGYGQDVVQRGWGAWGDSTFTEVMSATDAAEQRPEIDATRTAMMGGSFGGYMANWIATHTDRFRCIVSHASLWDLTSFGPTTDVPWYWQREMTPEMARANSPHLSADAISTPMLVVHGDKDYRVPISQGLALWWDLVRGFDGDPDDMPHKFLYFPDENHWVLSPQHAIVWYETVRAFLGTHLEDADFQRSAVL